MVITAPWAGSQPTFLLLIILTLMVSFNSSVLERLVFRQVCSVKHNTVEGVIQLELIRLQSHLNMSVNKLMAFVETEITF